MIASAGEFTGVPLATVLARAASTTAAHVRVEGGTVAPPTAKPGTPPFYYDKGLLLESPASRYDAGLGPERRIARTPARCAHALARPWMVRNWSVKWVQRIEVTAEPPDCWYHWQFYYYGNAPDDPNKEPITTIGVFHRDVSTRRSDDAPARYAHHPWTGLAVPGHYAGGGECGRWPDLACGPLEPPRERWLWGRWSYVWDAPPGQYRVMSRATDEVGRVEPQTRDIIICARISAPL